MRPYKNTAYKHHYFSASGSPITFKKQLMQSGEATLWQVTDPGKIAKIYHEPSLEKAEKLQKMLENPPKDPTKQQGHLSIIWPQALIYDEQGDVVGFLMTKIKNANTLSYVYNPKLRRKFAQGFNWYYLHTACMNLAWIVQALHEKSYVIGDIKPENFLVTPHALVSILDTDSFQIGKYFCPVGSEGLTPPELIDQDLLAIERQPYHDMFGIAVIFYLMLFGSHPFSGTWEGSELMPSRDFLVKEGIWLYAPETKIKPGPYTLPLKTVHPRLEELFHQTFTQGHKNPEKRPTSLQWMQGFQEALSSLEMCDKQVGHFYYDTKRNTCPWCRMEQDLGFDPFPTPKDFSKDKFLVQKCFEKAEKRGDDRELLRLWQNPYSKKYLQEDKKKLLSIKKAAAHQEFLEKFQRIFRKKPQEDRELISLWGKCKTFSNSLFSKEKKIGLGGNTVQNIIDQALQRQEKLNCLLTACEKKPADFVEVYNIWTSINKKSHPVFTSAMSIIDPVLQKYRNYQQVVKAIQKQEVEKVVSLWDEKSFSVQAKRDGLQKKVQEALKAGVQNNHVFESFNTSIFSTPTLLNIKWKWDLDIGKVQGAFVSISFSKYPTAPGKAEMPMFDQLITKEQYIKNRGIWFKLPPEYKGRKVYISIWPAQKQCGNFFIAGEPLHIHSLVREKVHCVIQYPRKKWQERFLRLMNRFSLTIKIQPSKSLILPEMDVVAAFGYPPSAHRQGTFSIGKLPSVAIQENETKTFTYKLPKWFNHEFEVSLLERKQGNRLKEEIYYEVV